MKKLLTTIMALALFSVAWGAETEPLFKGNELALNVQSGVEAGKNYDANLSAGVSYYITRNVGVEAEVPLYQTSGISVDNVSFGGVIRVPVFGILAPFAGAGARMSFHGDTFSGYGKVGLELRIKKQWSVYAQAEYDFPDVDSTFTKGTWVVGGGIKLILW